MFCLKLPHREISQNFFENDTFDLRVLFLKVFNIDRGNVDRLNQCIVHFRKNENILVEIICQQVELLQLFFNGDKIFRHLHFTDTIIYILKTIDHFILPFPMYPKEK